MPTIKFSDQQLIDLYNSDDEPSLYKIAQILKVSQGAVKARAKKLDLKPRPKKRTELSDRRFHTIRIAPQTVTQADRLAKKLKLTKSSVWEQAIADLYQRTYKK